MAATTEAKATVAGLDAASFLAPEDIPIKLRCAICNKLAINAFRLPCCDQSICENCHSRLPAQCPVCEHSPLSAEDCKPNKSLRTTIKVFLRTEEKKREQAKEKMRHNVLPAGPTAMAEPEQRDPAGPDASAEVSCSTDVASRGTGATGPKIVVAAATEAGRETLDAMVTNLQDDSHLPHWTHRHGTGDSDSHQKSSNPTEVEERRKDGLSTNDDRTGEGIEVVKTGKPNGFLMGEQNSPLNVAMGQAQHLVEPSGFNQMAGYSQGAFGTSGIQPGFSNMGWNMHDGFNAMYQDMQSPMPTGQWDMMPNMMGMPGMNGGPMAMSQGMYNGIGGQGMGMNGPGGMNGMNMGMGMEMEMAYDAGHSGYNGWNGPSSWNTGQDMFHPNAGGGGPARGRMGGGFGSNSSSGFHHQHPAATGFNVQSANSNYNPMPYGQHIRPNHDFPSGFNGGPGRGFFRGGPRRGGPGPGHLLGGRGGGSFSQAFPRNGEPFHHQLPSRPPPNRAESRQHNSTLPDLAETLGLSQATDAKSLAGAGSESGSNEPKNIGATTENTIEISGTRPGANGESTGNAVVVDGLGGDIATNTSVTHNRPQNGYTRSGEAAARSLVDDTPNWGETNSGDARPGGPDLPQSVPDWSPKVINAPSGPAALTQGDHSYSGFSGRGPTAHGGRGTSSMGSNGFGVTPPSGPAADRTKKPELPKVALVELKGQGVEGAPKAPKALREGLHNSGIRGRGFPSGGRNGLTTAGGQGSTSRLRSRSPKRGRSRSRPPSSVRDGRDARRQRSRSRSRDKDEQSQRRDQQRRRSRGRDRPQVDQHLSHTKGLRSRRASIDRSRSSSRSSTKIDVYQAQPEKETRSSRRSRKSRRSRRERSKERRRRRRSRARSRSPLAEMTRNGREPRDIGPSSDRRGSRERTGLNREESERSRRDAPTAREHSDYARHQTQRGHRGEDVKRANPKTRDTRPNARSPSDANLHTREREERNRERTLKEQQRRDTFGREHGRSSRDRKREREDDGGGPGDVGVDYTRDHNGDDLEGRSKRKRAKHRGQRGTVDAGADVSRRVNYKYEDDESVEARARRIEKEREATRWG